MFVALKGCLYASLKGFNLLVNILDEVVVLLRSMVVRYMVAKKLRLSSTVRSAERNSLAYIL